MHTLSSLCLALGTLLTAAVAPAADELSLDALFTADRLVEVEIFLSEEDWDEIRNQKRNFRDALQASRQFKPIDTPYTWVPGTVIIDGVVLPQVGVRKKGFFGSQDTNRPSLKIKLDKYDRDLNIDGLANLTLNNNKQDRSLMSQYLGYRLFNAAGSPAPRCGYAKVSVNGTNLGVYSHVETMREPALERGFGNSDGTLFEGTVVDFYTDWENSFERKLGRNEPGRKKIIKVIEALNEDNGAILLGTDAPGRARVPADDRQDMAWMLPEFDDADWISGVNGAGYERQRGYDRFIDETFDFEDQMFEGSTSLYLRFPFEIEDVEAIHNAGHLRLRMQSDDGFIAYLNGVEVARMNAPDFARWDSRATEPTPDQTAATGVGFDITPFRELLVDGRNILAIHGLNNTPESTDFLVAAELTHHEHDFRNELWQHVDEEAFYRFWALEGLLSFWDGYSGNRNNFFIYLNPETDRLHFMPWGADCLFENYSQIANDRDAPRSVRALGLIPNRLYQVPEARAKYAEAMRTLLDEHWDEDALLAETRRLEAMLAPHMSVNQGWSADFNRIRRFIRGRQAVIEAEINGPDMPEWDFKPGDIPAMPGEERTNGRLNAVGIMMAAARGDLDTFKRYLDDGGDVDVTDESGGTALGIAAMIGHPELVTWLLEHGADPNHQNLEGNGPLTGAGLFGRLDTTRLLLEAGADPRLQNAKGETPIVIASYPWSPELKGLVEFVSGMLQVDTDLESVRTNRPRVARMMREWKSDDSD